MFCLKISFEVLPDKRKEFEQAITTCQRLEKIDPTTQTAPDVLAECYLNMDKKYPGRYMAKAIAALELVQNRPGLLVHILSGLEPGLLTRALLDTGLAVGTRITAQPRRASHAEEE